ncbi:unnamed protein product [Mycena citricolor]|uniref:Uncharacterized protein n=1 Tax=Mycena citricolor TaxID=2018698 RepID=A0AAD2HBJ4_9AGAR|nr:unnamed protein product [Mycena citricolor]
MNADMNSFLASDNLYPLLVIQCSRVSELFDRRLGGFADRY